MRGRYWSASASCAGWIADRSASWATLCATESMHATLLGSELELAHRRQQTPAGSIQRVGRSWLCTSIKTFIPRFSQRANNIAKAGALRPERPLSYTLVACC